MGASRLVRLIVITACTLSVSNIEASRICKVSLEDLGQSIRETDSDIHLVLRPKKDASKMRRYMKLKKVVDTTLAALSIPLVAPVILAAGVAVKLEDPDGPIIFRQTRFGLNRQPFEIFKIRTMRSRPTQDQETPYKTQENDPRVTRVGKVLRTLKIDELPQVFNVLQGDMSLVGPRPLVTQEIEVYEQEIPGYGLRHRAVPGLTGYSRLASPTTIVDGVDPVEAFEIDLYYIQNQGLRFDFLIIVLTVFHIVKTATPEMEVRELNEVQTPLHPLIMPPDPVMQEF